MLFQGGLRFYAGQMMSSQVRRVLWIGFLAVCLLLVILILPAGYLSRIVLGLQENRLIFFFLAVFAVIALSVLLAAGQNLDNSAFLWVNRSGSRPRWLDYFMWGMTQLGNGLTGFILAILFYVLGDQNLAYSVLLGMISLWLTVELFKALTERGRPFLHHDEVRIVGYRARGLSFPSGHTAQIFFLISLLVQHYHPPIWGGVMLYGLAFLVGLTRMYVGAHYPRDVIGGALLGLVWGVITSLLMIAS